MANFPITSNQPMYDPQAVQPMRDELIAVGFEELLTPESVDNALGQKNDETALVMINSVCGCAAGSARPGISMALQHTMIPDKLYTAFAGQEREAVEHIRRTYLADFPPSSPSAALFKNGEVLFMLHRFDIEGRYPNEIADILMPVFEKFCSRQGPSILPEQFDQIQHAKACGSTIPRFGG